MKLKEFKQLMSKKINDVKGKKIRTKILAGAIIVALAGSGTGAYYTIRSNAADNAQAQTTVTSSTTSTTSSSSQTTSSDDEQKKEETVFVNADAAGSVQKVTVSDWLKNGLSAQTINDATSLQNIQNVKGDETYTTNADGSITWNAGGNDIYYQGTSTETLPVDVKISYTLDGKSVTPDEIVGKSGKVSIRFDYTNNEKKEVTIDGKTETISVPFAVVSGVYLDNSKFTNVTVTNGTKVNTGDNTVVLGYAMPGLTDSLAISDDIKDKVSDVTIPEYVEITADASDFSLQNTMTAVTSDVLADLNKSKDIDISDVKKDVNDLSDSTNALLEGTQSLADGLGTLNSSYSEFSTGIDSLNEGLKSAQSGVSTLASGSSELSDGANSVSEGLVSLNSGLSSADSGAQKLVAGYEGTNGAVSGASQVAGGASQVSAGVNQLASGLQSSSDKITTNINTYSAAASQADAAVQGYETQLQTVLTQAAGKTLDAATIQTISDLTTKIAAYSGQEGGAKGAVQALTGVQTDLSNSSSSLNALVTGAANVSDGAGKLNTGINQLYAGTQQLASGISDASDGSSQLVAGAAAVADGASQLDTGIQSLQSGADTLASGGDQLASGSSQLSDGISQLVDGSTTLNEGMIKYNDEGIQKIVKAFNGDVTDLTDRLNAVIDAGKNYNNYSGKSSNMNGSVKFVIETEAIGE